MTLQSADCRSLDTGRHPLASQPAATWVALGAGHVVITSIGWWNRQGGEHAAFNAAAERIMRNLQFGQFSLPPLTVRE